MTLLGTLALLLPAQAVPQLLTDLDAGFGPPFDAVRDAEPVLLSSFSGGLLFSARQTFPTPQLHWISDATGSEPLALATPGLGNPVRAVDLGNGRAVLLAKAFGAGSEVLSTDGTPDGTFGLPQLSLGLKGDPLDVLVAWRGRAWFLREPAAGQLELWSTDGTSGDFGVELTLTGAGDAASFTQLYVAGDRLYIATDQGTPQLFALSNPGANPQALGATGPTGTGPVNRAIEFAGELWFVGDQPGQGRELWRSDGTVAGTGPAFDLFPGLVSSNPEFLDADSSRLWLSASAGGIGSELFTVDAAGNLSQAADLTPGPGGELVLGGALLADGRLVFAGSPNPNPFTSDFEPYVSDGTPAGTSLVQDLVPGPNGSLPLQLRSFGGRVVFAANSAAGFSTWSTDGSAAGTVRLGPGPVLSGLQPLLPTDARVWWSVDDATAGLELSRSDGVTPNGAQLVNLALDAVSGSSRPRGLSRLGGQVLFAAERPNGDTVLGVTDGTAAGTSTPEGVFPVAPLSLTPLGNDLGDQLLFNGFVSGSGANAYVTDGTGSAFTALDGFTPPGFGSNPGDFVSMGDYLLYPIYPVAASAPPALVRTDGTSAGTQVISEAIWGFPQSLERTSIRLGDQLVFAGIDDTAGREPWITDGTTAGTAPLADLSPGVFASDPRDFVRLGDSAVFSASEDGINRELFRTDGTTAGTFRIADLIPGPDGSNPVSLTRLGDRVLFFAGNSSQGYALWSTDGTTAGTTFVKPLQLPGFGTPGRLERIGAIAVFADEGSPSGLWRTDGTLLGTVAIPAPAEQGFDAFDPIIVEAGDSGAGLFNATSAARGSELWLLPADGSAPQPLDEIWPGPGNSNPSPAFEFEGRMWFGATSPVVGNELFSVSLAELGAAGVETFGEGCSASGFEPSIGFSGGAGLGATAMLELSDADAGAPGFLFRSSDVAFVTLPTDCLIYLASPKFLGATVADGLGAGALAVSLPTNPNLVGAALYLQWVTSEPGGPLGGAFATSNALEVVVGP